MQEQIKPTETEKLKNYHLILTENLDQNEMKSTYNWINQEKSGTESYQMSQLL